MKKTKKKIESGGGATQKKNDTEADVSETRQTKHTRWQQQIRHYKQT